MFLPPDLRDWLPVNHIAHFILEAVEQLNLKNFKLNHRGSGSEQYPPSMMLTLLIYCYATGRFSSRAIEAATYSDIVVRFICGGDCHPDHDTICSFRRENGPLFSECFVKVLSMAGEMKCLKKVGCISVDGTKIKANASKHAAVSYKRAGEMIEQLELEVKKLMEKAEKAEAVPLDDGLSIPDEIGRREKRMKQLEHARKIIEERFQEKARAAYDNKLAEREERKASGQKLLGPKPQPPDRKKPDDKAQYNFTDDESRIMKAGNGKHFKQAYNAQAAVDTEGSYLIVGKDVTNHPNDKQELVPMVKKVDDNIRTITEVLADTGYFSDEAITEIEADNGPTVYVPAGKQGHHKSIKDLEKQADPQNPPDNAGMKEKMAHRLKTKYGKEKYKLRKQTVEPVFGIIKEILGFKHFHLRGLKKARLEWDLVTTAYNFKRLFKMINGSAVSENRVFGAING
jgi:transposase